MRGNAAILKCLIPSFVADFVYVTAWVDSDGAEYTKGNEFDGRKYHLNVRKLTAQMKNWGLFSGIFHLV